MVSNGFGWLRTVWLLDVRGTKLNLIRFYRWDKDFIGNEMQPFNRLRVYVDIHIFFNS